ncbi:hypothetical protein ACQ5SK_20865 [Bradyrhizobium japonicum]
MLDWTSRARRVVAEFRAAVTAYSDDPDIRRLVEELRVGSPDFERCWETQGVLAREGGERAFDHPTMGLLHYQQVSLVSRGLVRLSADDASRCANHAQPMTS